MPRITFDGKSYTLNGGETVLEGLLRQGAALTYSCKAGVCRSCMVRARSGEIPPAAQAGLKESWKARGYLMACVCVPPDDLELVAAGEELRTAAAITALKPLSHDVMEARLACRAPIDFRAGQYVTVVRSDGLARSYSIASLPQDGELELHVRRIAQGKMSSWFHEEARPGDEVTLLGPSGECFYVAGREDQPLLLAGTGTGLAPLYGIVRDSLRSGHRGPVHLFHGALHDRGLYLVDELRELSKRYANFRYTPSVLNGTGSGEIAVGPIDRVIADHVPDASGWRGFVCGDPNLVRDLKKTLFLSGMASRDIHSDAFVPAASTTA